MGNIQMDIHKLHGQIFFRITLILRDIIGYDEI